jgi:hypothetical protein
VRLCFTPTFCLCHGAKKVDYFIEIISPCR